MTPEPSSDDSLNRQPIEAIQEQTDVTLTSFLDAANSLGFWYGKVLSNMTDEIPQPDTYLLEFSDESDTHMMMPNDERNVFLMADDPESKVQIVGPPEEDLGKFADRISELPDDKAFFRSFYKSATNLSQASPIQLPTDEESLMQHIALIADDHIMGGLPVGGIAVREWLDIDYNPDGRSTLHPEVRFYFEDGEILTHWPRMSEDRFVQEKGNSRFFEEQKRLIEDEIETPREYAKIAAERFDPHALTIDFVRTTNGDWYAIDMAIHGLYWRPEDQRWANISACPPNSEHNLAETVGEKLPAPESPPEGHVAWRDPAKEPNYDN